MPSGSSRRGFVALCGTAALAGCTALADPEPDDVVAGVEWKIVRAIRRDRSRPVVESVPTASVEHRAPVARRRRIEVLDEETLAAADVSFPATGSLRIDGALAARLNGLYDEINYELVLTLYEREEVVGVPLGNSYGYRTHRGAFNRVDPGDRVVVHVRRKDDVPQISDVLNVTSA